MIEPGKNYFEIAGAYPWKLSDMPVSVARILRGNEAEHGMLISLDQTINPGKDPLQLRASILQGDPRFVRVERAPGKAVMRLRVRWQPPIINSTGIRSHRIDIGIFADNGASISAPSPDSGIPETTNLTCPLIFPSPVQRHCSVCTIFRSPRWNWVISRGK